MGSEFTPQSGDRSGAVAVANTLGGTALADADYFANTGREWLRLSSTAGGTVYMVRRASVDGQTPPDKPIVVPALTPVFLGPFPIEYFSSTVSIYKTAGDTIAARIIRS